MSRVHILDTNAFRWWVDAANPHHAEAVARITELGDTFVFLSTITAGEVEFGLARPHNLDQEIVRSIRQGLSRFKILEIDRHVTECYGRLRAWLLERFRPERRKIRSLSQLSDPVTDLELGIQENDLWLVSQAITNDLVLVTGDKMTHLMEAAAGTRQQLRRVTWG